MHEILHDSGLYELRAPSVSSWSCGEQAGHILLVARVTADKIEGNLADPSRDREREPAPYAFGIFDGGDFPRGRAQAPVSVTPLGKARDDFMTLAPTVEARWDAIASRREELRGCSARAEHFAFGWLTCSEWVRACAIHTAHHLAIVRDVGGLSPPR